jgi:hypothetical protein
MLLPAGQVITFKGRDGAARAAEMVREMCGRAEQVGSSVHVKHRTHYKPSLTADVDQFGFDEAAAGRNGRHEAMRV